MPNRQLLPQVSSGPKTKLLDQVRETIRRKHYSMRTEAAYIDWIKRYIFFHQKRHPKEMGAPEMEQFLNHLAVNKNVAASTQNQALNALVFLYKQVLKVDLAQIRDVVRAPQRRKLPVVLTREETDAVLAHLSQENRLLASLLYGSGLRLMEAVRLRMISWIESLPTAGDPLNHTKHSRKAKPFSFIHGTGELACLLYSYF